jgi:hypothetical protein
VIETTDAAMATHIIHSRDDLVEVLRARKAQLGLSNAFVEAQLQLSDGGCDRRGGLPSRMRFAARGQYAPRRSRASTSFNTAASRDGVATAGARPLVKASACAPAGARAGRGGNAEQDGAAQRWRGRRDERRILVFPFAQ